MTANKEILYWQSQDEWWTLDETTRTFTLKEDAPERVRKSFEMWEERRANYL